MGYLVNHGDGTRFGNHENQLVGTSLFGKLDKATGLPTIEHRLSETARPDGRSGRRIFSRILVGVEPARSADVIETVNYLAERLGAEVIVAHVALASTAVPGNESDGLPATSEEQRLYDSLERQVRHSFGVGSSKVPLKILHGDPAERLAEYATFTNCDLVVVGSRHLGALKSALLGSVSSGLLKRSNVPVLVLR